jgi:TadE-like protein
MRRRRGRNGSTLVESSIILLLFLVIVIAVMDVGQVLFFHCFIKDRVRNAARWAAVHGYDAQAIRNVAAYNTPTPGGDGAFLFGLDPAMVQVNHYNPGTLDDRVEVTVSTYTMHFVSPWLARDFIPGPFRAVVPVESGGSAN